MRKTAFLVSSATAFFLGLSGCNSASDTPQSTDSEVSVEPVSVEALGETEPVGTENEDAADDPAIWRNAENPAASLIVATDKRAGLLVYDLSGKLRFSEDSGRINNVDLADMGDEGVIVVASDRNDPENARLGVWRLDTAKASLTKLGTVPGGEGEGYGLCLWHHGSGLIAYSVLKDGTVAEYAITVDDTDVPSAKKLRTLKVPSQSEGCVVDPRDGTFYLGEEDAGIWRFAPGQTEGELLLKTDGSKLVADVEGLALLPDGDKGGWLLASSQGDNAYAVYALPDLAFAGRFRIAEGTFGSTEETDGIEVKGGSFGDSYPDGLFIAQDGENGDRAQNFKLASWADISKALSLK
ncbi:phytase [Altericroceibacterium spongiae]|uniref:Phytase n=1 Tax=Altericroceibacterium spongiae TaxID=2320269 RepID=A0A420ECA2_9SPHN|nr:phytase [Altericroceibacterium spongiae]RKF18306.1 phytase [Altericroceibacterium spongiae]